MALDEGACRYSVDTNTLITIATYYPPHVFGRVWEYLQALTRGGRLCVCDQVRDEYTPREATPVRELLAQHPDAVVPWADFEAWLSALMADGPSKELVLVDEEPTSNREVADPYVVALGLMLDGRSLKDLTQRTGIGQRGAVVTAEKSRPGKRPTQIPDVCLAYGLECLNWLGLLEREGYTDSSA